MPVRCNPSRNLQVEHMDLKFQNRTLFGTEWPANCPLQWPATPLREALQALLYHPHTPPTLRLLCKWKLLTLCCVISLMVYTVNSEFLAFPSQPAEERWSTSTWPIFHWSAESPWWMLPADYGWFRQSWNLNTHAPYAWSWENMVRTQNPQGNRNHHQYARSTALEEVYAWKPPFDLYPTYINLQEGQRQTSLGVL